MGKLTLALVYAQTKSSKMRSLMSVFTSICVHLKRDSGHFSSECLQKAMCLIMSILTADVVRSWVATSPLKRHIENLGEFSTSQPQIRTNMEVKLC